MSCDITFSFLIKLNLVVGSIGKFKNDRATFAAGGLHFIEPISRKLSSADRREEIHPDATSRLSRMSPVQIMYRMLRVVTYSTSHP